MERIPNLQKHPREAYLLALSRLFERAHYYGIRSILILYLIGETFSMSRSEAFEYYGAFIGYLFLSKIVGALLGDLILGNRRTYLIGGVLSIIGSFVLIIPTTSGVYVGLGLLTLGSGLYTPNMLAEYGKLYLDKTKLLDAGFTALFLVINIGGFFGPFVVARIREEYDFKHGIFMSGLFMIASVLILFFIGKTNVIIETSYKFIKEKKVIYTVGVILLVGLYWMVYSIISTDVYSLQVDMFEYFSFEKKHAIPVDFASLFSGLLFSVFAMIIWSYYYYNQYIKLGIGFLFATLSVGLLLLIPEAMNQQGILILIVSIVLMGLAETHISPVVLSVVTKYSNPKYLAIITSISVAITGFFTPIYFSFIGLDDSENIKNLKIGFIALAVISAVLFVYLSGIYKKREIN